MADQPPKKIHRIDWARMMRDFATGKFTDQELATKYSTAREVVNRRRRSDRAKDPYRPHAPKSKPRFFGTPFKPSPGFQLRPRFE